MDLQKLMDMMSNTARDTRKEYHVTLGKLISHIKATLAVYKERSVGVCHDGVFFDDKEYVGPPTSYRGYYADLAFEPQEHFMSAADLLKILEEQVLDKKLEGYKGGEYLMGADTPLWIDHSGVANGVAVVDIDNVTIDGEFVIMLKTKVV
jgi:hypothetical protein